MSNPSRQPPQRPSGDLSDRWRALVTRFRGLSRNAQIGVGCGSLIAVCLLCSVVSAAFGGGASSTSGTPTATAAATATHRPAAPTATPKPTATATATETATPVPLPLAFTCAEAVDNSYGKVCVHTAPGAQLSITVTYCSGKDAKSASLGPATADGKGNHEWDWVPNTVCKGPATAFVTASLNGQTTNGSQGFQVT